MDKKQSPELEPQWLKDAAKSMLKGQKESYGDEEQDEIMAEIEKNTDDQL